jgi:hypothetical protein
MPASHFEGKSPCAAICNVGRTKGESGRGGPTQAAETHGLFALCRQGGRAIVTLLCLLPNRTSGSEL